MSLAKAAANAVLLTLTEYDAAAIINFSSMALSWNDTLVPMTVENLEAAKD